MGRRRRRRVRRGAAAAVDTAVVAKRRVARGRSWLPWLAAAGVVGALAYVGVSETRQAAYAARLPSLPDLSGHPTVVREHLGGADRAARANPTSAEAVGSLGLAYHADMFYDRAERGYAIAEDLSGFAWPWTYYRALAQGERGDADGLAAGLRRVVAAAPDFGPAWWRLGEAEFKAGREDRAGEAWRRALSLPEPPRPTPAGSPARAASAPIAAYAALGLARVAMLQGDADRARELLESVTASVPGFGPAYRVLGDAYAALDLAEEAEQAVRTADRLPAYEPYGDPMIDALVRESRSTTFLFQQAATADLSTNAVWREHVLRRALTLEPENPDVVYELATMLRALGRDGEALELLRRRQTMVPGDFRVLADIGRCLANLRRFGEAESFLRRALGGLDDANTRYGLGVVLDQSGRPLEAIAEYQRALDRDPNHLDTLNNLGVALVRQGSLERAASRLRRVLDIDPDHADAHTNLGLVLASQGDADQAAREFREALRINPAHPQAREALRAIEMSLSPRAPR